MSHALNLISNNFQGYGLAESSSLPCLGVSGRASISASRPQSECKSLHVKISHPKCSLRHVTFVCKASSGGQRRNPDFPKQNRHGFSRSRNRPVNERDNSENLDESEFLSTKNGPLLSLSNGPRSQPTASPGPREREIVELFKKVQAQLRERAAIKEEKRFETVKGQNKENETVDSLLKLLRKHSVAQGKRKVNGGSANEFNLDHPRQGGHSGEDKSKSFFNSDAIVTEEPQETNRHSFSTEEPQETNRPLFSTEEPQETNRHSFSRPPSSFRRRSPVPRVRYEPIVSTEDTANSGSLLDIDEKTSESYSETFPVPESEFSSEPAVNVVSGLGIEQEEVLQTELEPETAFADSHVAGELSEAELSNDEEDNLDEKGTEEQLMELKSLNSMKLAELRALAKARGMKGFSKLKKSELVGLLSDDSIYP